MDRNLQAELEELLEHPLWSGERFPDRDLSESEKWQIAFDAADDQIARERQQSGEFLGLIVCCAAVAFIIIIAFALLHQLFVGSG